jgi:hypothetical protein
MALEHSRRDVNSLITSTELAAVFSDTSEWNKTGHGIVKQWFDDLKAWEDDETFKRAFEDDRMTIRGICGDDTKPSDTSWKRGVKATFGTKAEAGARSSQMTLYKGIDGVKERMKPANFPFNRGAVRLPKSQKAKYVLGLHDLSATMLTHERVISDQYKPYQLAIWAFMPLPQQEDLKTFYCLNKIANQTSSCEEYRRYVRTVASKLTRLKYAQACDRHTTYIDVAGLNCYSPAKTETSIRYGLTGLMKQKRAIDLVLHSANSQFDKPKPPTDDSVRFYISASKKDPSLAGVLEFVVYEKKAEMYRTDTTKLASGVNKKAKLEEISIFREYLRPLWTRTDRDTKLNDEILSKAAAVSGYKMSGDVKLSAKDIEERKRLALEYKSILSAEKNNAGRGANEVVIAYREFGSDNVPKQFPLFTELDLTTDRFYVIGDDLERTGAYITDAGVYSAM